MTPGNIFSIGSGGRIPVGIVWLLLTGSLWQFLPMGGEIAIGHYTYTQIRKY